MTRLVPISSITIPPSRQRREFDQESIQELVVSISESSYGLMHPLVVRTGADGGYELVAGERRLRAIAEVYELGGQIRFAGEIVAPGHVPVSDLGDLPPFEAFEAELEENVRRKDLTVLEQAQATSRLMDLRLAQAAERGQPPPSTKDVAREVYSPGAVAKTPALGTIVRDQVMVARHAHLPGVKKATSLREAVAIVKKEVSRGENAALAEKLGGAYSTSLHTLVQGDCLEWLADAPPYSFDVILTDPPYGMGADTFGDSGKSVVAEAHSYDDSSESWGELMERLCAPLFTIAAEGAHAYLFCDIEKFFQLSMFMSEAGWRVHRTPLIWHNPNGFRAPWPEYGPQRKYELILYARKGDKRTNYIAGDVLTYRKDPALGHPAQKPVPLLLDLLKRSATPSSRVLDPFGGSGSIVEACHELKIPCTMIERDPSFFGIAAKRVAGLSVHEGSLW